MAVSGNLRNALDVALTTQNNSNEIIKLIEGGHAHSGGVINSVQTNDGSGGFTGTSTFKFASNVLTLTSASSQIGIGVSVVGEQAQLELGGTDAGLIMNRLTDVQQNTLSDAAIAGMQIYNSSENRVKVHNGTFFQGLTTAAATLTDAGEIDWDATKEVVTLSMLTATGARTINNPTNLINGGTYVIILKQDALGSLTVTWGGNYKWKGGTAPTLTAAGDAVDIITFITDGTNMYGVDSLNFS